LAAKHFLRAQTAGTHQKVAGKRNSYFFKKVKSRLDDRSSAESNDRKVVLLWGSSLPLLLRSTLNSLLTSKREEGCSLEETTFGAIRNVSEVIK